MIRSAALLATAALLAGTAHAAPFTGKGLPADTVAFIHVDAEASADGELAKAIKALAEKNPSKTATALGNLSAQLNSGNIVDASAGIIIGKKNTPEIAAIIHVNSDAKVLYQFAADHPEVKRIRAGNIDWIDLADAMNKTGAQRSQPLYVAAPSKDTFLIASLDCLEASAAAATGKTASFSTPAAAKSLAGSGAGIVGYFPEAAVKAFAEAQAGAPPVPGLKALRFSLGESDGHVKLDAVATMTDDESAQQANATASMYQMVFAGMLTRQKAADAKQKADNAFFASLLQSLKFSADGASLKIGFDYPAAKLAAKLAEKQDLILKAAEGATK